MRYLAAGLALLLTQSQSHAATYQHNGKEISKGAALLVLVKNPDAKVYKIDQMYLDMEKGTLKVRKAK